MHTLLKVTKTTVWTNHANGRSSFVCASAPPAQIEKLAEEFHIMQTQGMDCRRKDPEQQIEGMQQPRHQDAEKQVAEHQAVVTDITNVVNGKAFTGL